MDVLVPIIIGGLLLLIINSRGLVARLAQIYIVYVAISQLVHYWGNDYKKAIIGFLVPMLILSPLIIRTILKTINLFISGKKGDIEKVEEKQ